MWQRIQTLFLGIAALLIVSLFWSDAAGIVSENGGIESIGYTENGIYLVWLILLTVLQVLALGGYKWRMRQIRVVIVAAICCLGFQGFLVYDYFALREEMTFSWTAVFPLCAAVMDGLAARNIMLDEAIVQSANRLRQPRNRKR